MPVSGFLNQQYSCHWLARLAPRIDVCRGEVGQSVYACGAAGYRDALCESIGKRVEKGITVPAERIDIELSDGSSFSISPHPEDQIGPEAAVLHDDLMRIPVCVWNSAM
jgi:hypothetical protein